VCAASELAVNHPSSNDTALIDRLDVAQSVRDLNRVLVPVMMFLLQERRERRLLNKTLRGPAAEIEYALTRAR
jgi:hypothetical protein